MLAQYETDWREVIDSALDCRFTWTLSNSPTSELDGMACYTREQTIGLTTQIVMRDWGELDIPASMQSLVDETSSVLQLIADVDLPAICGDGNVPAETDECNKALGSRSFNYTMLESKLDAWGPYL